MPLSEERRKQLDGIVTKLAEQDAPEEDVHAIVNDFKSKYENEATQAENPSLAKKVVSAFIPSHDDKISDTSNLAYPGYDPKWGPQKTSFGEKAVYKAGGAITDVTEAPKRAIGAALFQAEGDTFLKRMSDPEAGWLRSARKALAQSDAPTAVKILGAIGIGVVEDPLSALAGVLKSTQIAKANAAAFPNATKAVKAGKEVSEAAALKRGHKGSSTGQVEGVPFTKAQQHSLAGEEITPDIQRTAAREAQIQKENPTVWNDFLKDQQDALSSKAAAVKDKHGFSDQSPKELGDNVMAQLDNAYENNKGIYKKKYDEIEAAAASAPDFSNEALADAKKAMDDLGAYPVERDWDASGNAIVRPKFTTHRIKDGKAEVTTEVPETFTFQKEGQSFQGTVQDAQTGVAKTVLQNEKVRTVEFITSEYIAKRGMGPNGVSHTASKALMDARKLIDEAGSYQNLKAARSMIGQHIGKINDGVGDYGWADRGKLKTAYAKLSAAMEEHILKSGGGPNGNGAQAVKDWKIADGLMSGKGDFAYVRKLLAGSGPDAVATGESVIKRLTNSENSRNYRALVKIKGMEENGMIPRGVSQNLQNALFNSLMEKSSRVVNGRTVIDGELLMKNANKIPPSMYNNVFTDDQADDIAQLVLEGMAQKLSGKIKIIESNPNAAGKMFKDAAGDIGMWAMFRGGPKGWLKYKAGKLLTKALLSTGDRAATRYIRSVDNQSIVSGLLRPQGYMAGLQAAELDSQDLDQPTPSPEAP